MIENELKYIIEVGSIENIEAALGPPKLIQQGYLPGNGRVRTVGEICWFTYKMPVEETVFEIEKEITKDEFRKLWPHTKQRLTKYRFFSPHGDVHWDIDFFLDGTEVYFAMAEVEMPEAMKEPPAILPLLEPHLIFAVPRDKTFQYSSKRVGDPSIGRGLLRDVLAKMRKTCGEG